MSRQVDVGILKHQADPFRLVMRGEPVTITLAWGRGLGKSFFARLIIWLLVAKWYGKKRKTLQGEITGIRIYMLMPTLKQFKQVHGALLQAENEGEWSFLGGKLDRTDYSLRFPDGSFFIPVPAAVATSERGRGFRGDVTIIDEGDDIDPSVRHSVTRPWFTEPWALGIELVMGTPKRGRYGLLYELFQLGKSKEPDTIGYHSFRVKSEECPEVVSPKVLADAKREYPQTYAREYEADFDSAEGLVYPFDEDFHVREPPDVRYLHDFGLGIDHGWQDPGVFLLCAIQGHGEDSILWWLDEVYRSECPNGEWDKIARDNYQGLDAYPDPSRPDRIVDLRKAGLKVHEVDNSIEPGVARLANLMVRRQHEGDGVPDTTRFCVSPRCVNAIRELKSYRRKRDPNARDRFLEDIEDKNNHSLDAGRYYAMGKFGPISTQGNHRTEVPWR
jgi:hypothetical protein